MRGADTVNDGFKIGFNQAFAWNRATAAAGAFSASCPIGLTHIFASRARMQSDWSGLMRLDQGRSAAAERDGKISITEDQG